MEFRPCIDIHNGMVKQIVGSSLSDEGDKAKENFVSGMDADFYARSYKEKGLKGGHVILLNAVQSPWYEATKEQACKALRAYPGGLQAGGGITDENARDFLEAGASHVIVTSYVFKDGQIQIDNLKKLVRSIGKKRLVLDISCRKRNDKYYIVTDRWQKFTEVALSEAVMTQLAGFCDEFLVHAVDVEGKANGIEQELVALMANGCPVPVTYAGGVGTYADITLLNRIGKGMIHITIGSSLDLFGGSLALDKVLDICKREPVK